MEGIKKEPHPARSAARIDKSRRETDHLNISQKKGLSNIEAIKQDARVLQFLKQEFQRKDTPGAVTLEEIFRGLLSVHNRNLITLADALQKEGEKWPR